MKQQKGLINKRLLLQTALTGKTVTVFDYNNNNNQKDSDKSFF